MTRMLRGFALPVLALALVGGQALAESKESDPVRFSILLKAYYTDNRDSAPDSVKESTWDYHVKPRVSFKQQGEQSLLDLYYAPSYRYRTDPSDIQNESEVHHDVGLKGKYRSSPRTEWRAWDEFHYTDDPAIERDLRTLRIDRSYKLNWAELGMIHDLSERVSVDVSGQHLWKKYDEEAVSPETDEMAASAGGTLSFVAVPTVRIQVLGGYLMQDYDTQLDIDRDFDVVKGAVGLEKTFSPSLKGGLSAGVQQISYADDTLDSQTVPYGDLWVRGWTKPSFRLSGVIGHGVRAADVYPFASQEYTEVRAGIECDPSARFTINLNGGYREASYDEDALPGDIVARVLGDPALLEYVNALNLKAEGDETTITAEIGVTYRLTDASSISLMQRYEDVDSDVGSSFTKNASAVTLVKQF